MIGTIISLAGEVANMMGSMIPDEKKETTHHAYSPDSFRDLGLNKYMYAGIGEQTIKDETILPNNKSAGLATLGSALSMAGGIVGSIEGSGDKSDDTNSGS